MIREALTFFEIDIKYCDLVYGEAPCTAELGVTGEHKCFNTRNFSNDCQDLANYTESYKTVRFGMEAQPFVASMPCLPYMQSCDVKNAEIHPGEDIGLRATFTATFRNGRHSDAGFDKYVTDRDYNPFEQGTFWGKFRARNPYLQNVPCRVIRGFVGSDEWDIEHFVLSTMQGPDSGGAVTISGKDFMYLLSDKTAQAPAASEGYLSTDYPAGSSSVTLEPAGIGSTYPASGKVSIGESLYSFTRSVDVLTISGGTVEDHDADDIVQLALEYEGQTVADIIYDLVVNYSPLTADRIDKSAWDELVLQFSDTLYGAIIVKPTAVEKLINELVEQAGLVLYGNTRTQKIEFDILRPDSVTGQRYDERRIRLGTFKQTDQPNKRFSQVWVFYNQRDPFKNLDEPGNFYSAYVRTPGENPYETESIKKIFSRWIPRGARSVANDVASRAISRYVNPPRLFGFSLFAGERPQLGQVCPISHPALETAFGGREAVNCVLTGIKTKSDGFDMRAEELKFDASLVDLNRTFIIDYDSYNLNLREIYDDAYATVDEVNPITFIITPGVRVGSNFPNSPAIRTGEWPVGVAPILVVQPGAYLLGGGGGGGLGTRGGKGSDALLVESPLQIDNQGLIGGGGGGGAGQVSRTSGGIVNGKTRGGGGAGFPPGLGYNPGALETGGTGSAFTSGTTASGGDLGENGDTTPNGTAGGSTIEGFTGGVAGRAIQGVSMVTFINAGDIRGAQVG